MTDTPTVLASILVEAALSAIAGVIVFVVSLAWVRGVDAPLLPLVAFAILCALLLHPRIFRPLGDRLLKPFGAAGVDPLPFPLMLILLLFYCGTWLIGGLAVYFLLRSLGSDPGLETIPYLGGVSAVGAIVSVLAVFVPSGLGARGVDVRTAARGHEPGGRARRDAPEPARNHARRVAALRRRCSELAIRETREPCARVACAR